MSNTEVGRRAHSHADIEAICINSNSFKNRYLSGTCVYCSYNLGNYHRHRLMHSRASLMYTEMNVCWVRTESF